MLRFLRIFVAALVVIGAGSLAHPGQAQNPPAIIFESMMDTYFDDKSGLISFSAYDVAFAPQGKAKAMVGVVDAKGKVIAKFPFYPDYKVRNGVFGRIQVKVPADVKLTKPGRYALVFVMNDKAISRLPFSLMQTGAGKDPFNPAKAYAFDGLWRRLGYIVAGGSKAKPIPDIWVWLGGLDMATPAKFQEYFFAELVRGGKVVAHSKRRTAFFSGGHFKRRKFNLFRPHPIKKEANAVFFTMKDLLADGDYELRITRRTDKKLIRNFRISVAQGKLRTIRRTELGYKPAINYIVPRVTRKGSTAYEFVEATWIVGK